MIQPRNQAWAKWRSLVSEQEKSGQSVATFCRSREAPESQFYYWKRRLKEAAAPQFVEVRVAKPGLRDTRSAPGPTIEVQLSNGRSLLVGRGFDASPLAGFVGRNEVRVMIELPSLHTLDQAQAARINPAAGGLSRD